VSSEASRGRLLGRLLTRRRPDIEPAEFASLMGLTGWMLAVGLGNWIYPDQQYAVFARVADAWEWQLAITTIAIAKAWSLVLGYRRETWAFWLRRGIMVAVVFWWCFLVGALLQADPFWPGIGAHLGCAYASGWALYRVTLRRQRDGGG
jgi:hypothetical protein